jgi:hypothetical protein
MKGLELRGILLIMALILTVVAVSGCDDWDWLDLGSVDTNITTTMVIKTVVTDIDGNPIPNTPVYISVGKVSASQDVPASPELFKVMTDSNGVAMYDYTMKLDHGDGIWYGASTEPAITDFRNSLYSTNNTLFYDDAQTAGNGSKKANVYDQQNLYKVTGQSLIDGLKDQVDDGVFTVREKLQTLTTSSDDSNSGESTETPVFVSTPTPTPGTGFTANIGDYGMSSSTVRLGDNISAFLNVQNTGNVPIKDLEMVGQIFVYDAGKKSYVPWDSTLVREAGIDPAHIDYSEKGVNIQPGAQHRAMIEKEVPKTHDVFGFEVPIPEGLVTGKYKMIVQIMAVDANGKKLDMGSRSSTFEIVGSGQ